MALSGSFSGNILSGAYTLRVDWSATQNVASNTSKITANMYLVIKSGWNLNIGARSDNTTTIAGTSHTWSSPAINKAASTTKLAAVTSGNITHNADGTKSVTISATFYIRFTRNSTGVYYEKITASQTIMLNTIPRATQPTLSASSVNMGSTVTINMPRASSSFTHDLAYSFAGSAYTSIGTGKGTSYTWTVPDLASKIPSATSGTVTIRCITKNGSTTIGTKTVLLTAKVPTTSDFMPSISSVAIAEQTSGLAAQFGAYIQNKSKIKATITAAGAKGSTIKTYSTTFAGKTYTGSSWTSGVIAQSGSLSLTTTVTDSRGRTAKKTTTISVLAYAKPSISAFTARRATQAGVEDIINGTHVSLAYTYSVTSLNAKNTANFKVEIKGINEGTWQTILTGSDLSAKVTTPVVLPTPQISTDNSYDLKATLYDWFGTETEATFLGSIKSGAVILDLRAEGDGIAFNKVAELPNLFDIGFPARFFGGTQPIEIPAGTDLNSLLTPNIYRSVVAAGDGTTSNYNNCPIVAAQSFVIELLPMGSSGAVMQRFTICSKEYGGTFERHYYQGAWGSWYRTFTRRGVVLWSGAYYMQESQTITLSEPISAQVNGVVLSFSAYSDGTAEDKRFQDFFIPKYKVIAKEGCSHCFTLEGNNFAVVAAKNLYISDTQIKGHDNNIATGTGASGITYNNKAFVLRYVIGV